MKKQELTRNECLENAGRGIRQILSERSPDALEFAAIREWVRRAEYAHLNNGTIRESEFQDVSEYLDSIK